jgi:hypothetical protein
MASAVQERRQAPADGPGRTGKEDPVTHHRYSFVTMRSNRRCTARCFRVLSCDGRAPVTLLQRRAPAHILEDPSVHLKNYLTFVNCNQCRVQWHEAEVFGTAAIPSTF